MENYLYVSNLGLNLGEGLFVLGGFILFFVESAIFSVHSYVTCE